MKKTFWKKRRGDGANAAFSSTEDSEISKPLPLLGRNSTCSPAVSEPESNDRVDDRIPPTNYPATRLDDKVSSPSDAAIRLDDRVSPTNDVNTRLDDRVSPTNDEACMVGMDITPMATINTNFPEAFARALNHDVKNCKRKAYSSISGSVLSVATFMDHFLTACTDSLCDERQGDEASNDTFSKSGGSRSM